MPTETITILRRNDAQPWAPHHDEIDADVEKEWAIHETIPLEIGGWTVTHIPSGYSVLHTQHEIAAKAARAELLTSGLDWSFTDPRAVTSAHKIVGKRVKEKYEGK